MTRTLTGLGRQKFVVRDILRVRAMYVLDRIDEKTL